jgi:cell pole-organizing protein PopZ
MIVYDINNDKENNSNEGEMSMEDILASIRKYVADTEDPVQSNSNEYSNNQNSGSSNNSVVINLEKSQIALQPTEETKYKQEQINNKPNNSSNKADINPFGKLTNALKAYGKHKEEENKSTQLTLDKFLENIATPAIKEWIEQNMARIVEEVVNREIEKLKDTIN